MVKLLHMYVTFDLYWLKIEACTGVNRLREQLPYTEGIFIAVLVSPPVQSSSLV